MIASSSQNFAKPGLPQLPLSYVTNPQAIWFCEGSVRGLGSTTPQQEGYGSLHGFYAIANDNPGPGSRRHKGGSNFVCYDGHAEWGQWEKIEPITNPYPGYGTAADIAMFTKYWDVDGDGLYPHVWNNGNTW